MWNEFGSLLPEFPVKFHIMPPALPIKYLSENCMKFCLKEINDKPLSIYMRSTILLLFSFTFFNLENGRKCQTGDDFVMRGNIVDKVYRWKRKNPKNLNSQLYVMGKSMQQVFCVRVQQMERTRLYQGQSCWW